MLQSRFFVWAEHLFCFSPPHQLTPSTHPPPPTTNRRYIVLLRDAAATDSVEDICSAFAPVVGPLSKQSEEEAEDRATKFDVHEEEEEKEEGGAGSSNTTREERWRRWGRGPGRVGLPCLLRVRGLCRRIYRRGTLLDGRGATYYLLLLCLLGVLYFFACSVHFILKPAVAQQPGPSSAVSPAPSPSSSWAVCGGAWARAWTSRSRTSRSQSARGSRGVAKRGGTKTLADRRRRSYQHGEDKTTETKPRIQNSSTNHDRGGDISSSRTAAGCPGTWTGSTSAAARWTEQPRSRTTVWMVPDY
jgi:hypothetical protein